MQVTTQQSNETFIDFNMFQNPKQNDYFIRSSNKNLNQFLQNGLHLGLITQLYGEAGSGKTQIAMLFTIGAMMENKIVGWLSTEKQLSWGRFTDLVYAEMNQAEYQQKEKYLRYCRSHDFTVGLEFIQRTLEKIKDTKKNGIIIIDSIYGLLESCFEKNGVSNDHFQRSRKQAQLTNRLRWLAKMSNAAILLINHAADAIDKRRSSYGRKFVPALGPSWEFNSDQTIQLSKKNQTRSINIIHSPKCRIGSKAKFRIDKDRIIWITQEGNQMISLDLIQDFKFIIQQRK